MHSLASSPAIFPLPGATLSAAYTHDEQTYERYEERLSAGTFSRVFDRSGKRIPGVPEDVLNVRAGYRQASGPLAGLGGFLEWNTKSDTWMDNANLLKAPGYAIVNAGLSYDPPSGTLSRLRFTLSVQNLSDKAYVGSAGNIADSISSATGAHTTAAALQTVTGSIYAGAPRTVTVGVRARF